MRVGASLKPCRIQSPNSKPFVESVFRTLNMRCFHTLEGTTFSNPEQKADYESENEATYSLKELDEILRIKIDEYHHSIHSQLGKAPILAWNDWKDEKGNLVQVVPKEEIAHLLNTVKRVTINKGTVRFDGLVYSADILREIELKMAQSNKKSKVHIYINPYDIATVEVQDPFNEHGPLITAYNTSVDPDRPTTLYEHQQQKAEQLKQRQHQQNRLDELNVEEMFKENINSQKKIKDNAVLRKQRHIESAKKKARKKPSNKQKKEIDLLVPNNAKDISSSMPEAFNDMSWGEENE